MKETLSPEELELARIERNRYQREYYAAHREQVKEYNRRSLLRRACKREEEARSEDNG